MGNADTNAGLATVAFAGTTVPQLPTQRCQTEGNPWIIGECIQMTMSPQCAAPNGTQAGIIELNGQVVLCVLGILHTPLVKLATNIIPNALWSAEVTTVDCGSEVHEKLCEIRGAYAWKDYWPTSITVISGPLTGLTVIGLGSAQKKGEIYLKSHLSPPW